MRIIIVSLVIALVLALVNAQYLEETASNTASTSERLSIIDSLLEQLANERASILASLQTQELSDEQETTTGVTLLQPPLERCINADATVVYDDNGAATSERVNNNTPVKLWAKTDASLFKLGYNRWVKGANLKMKCEATPAPSSNKAAEALKEIFASEGQCQNWSSDSGNKFQGRIGWTCQGLIPSVCWNNRFSTFQFANPNSYSGHPADFCKYAYDLNKSSFNVAAAKIYTNNYFGPGGCNPLPQPAFFVCADIAVNSGTGRSQQYLNELGGLTSTSASGIKAYARKLNERHRQDYIRWSASGPNATFRQGWLNRAARRDEYINSYPL